MDTIKENNYAPKIRDVLLWPNDELHVECTDVEEFDNDLRNLVADMLVTMTANEGVGLAAPQIGVHRNIIVIRLEADNPLTLINPEIIESSSEMFEFEEGCLSVPGHFEKRKRPYSIGVRFKDLAGEEKELQFLNLYAFAIQHEIDHLRGKVFVDGASWFKQGRIEKKIKRGAKRREEKIEAAKAAMMQHVL